MGEQNSIAGPFQFQNFIIELDGKVIDGGEGGDIHCPAGAPVVHAGFTETSRAPVVAKAGVHRLSVSATSCNSVFGSKTVTFTVH